MMEPLKNMFQEETMRKFAYTLHSYDEDFQVERFLKLVFDEEWETLELKARCRKISISLGKCLPSNYQMAIDILEKAVSGYSFAIFFPDFVEVVGLDDWDISIKVLERNTQYWSSEFAVRAFILKDEKRMMKQMLVWTTHESEHVRRLASEGCRPMLPWGQSIPQFKKDPSPILPILEALKKDDALYVRKSVANNLNDISKTHPQLVIDLMKTWIGKDERTDWIIKHGCRSLLKKGNLEIMQLFGYQAINQVHIKEFHLEKDTIAIGEELVFMFDIVSDQDIKIRIEYGIDYIKANGKTNQKIFKLSEVSLKAGKQLSYVRKQSFKDTSVRKHYTGKHTLTLIINGTACQSLAFDVIKT